MCLVGELRVGQKVLESQNRMGHMARSLPQNIQSRCTMLQLLHCLQMGQCSYGSGADGAKGRQ